MTARQFIIELTDADTLPLAKQGIAIVLPTCHWALPKAPLTQDATDDIFGGHTPSLWCGCPFTLIEHTLGMNPDGETTTHSVLWDDPQATQCSPNQAYRLIAPALYPVGIQGVKAIQISLGHGLEHQVFVDFPLGQQSHVGSRRDGSLVRALGIGENGHGEILAAHIGYRVSVCILR